LLAGLAVANAESRAGQDVAPAAKQVKVRCECSVMVPDPFSCRDIATASKAEIVTWYEQAYEPPSPDFDWGNYCFSKKGGYEKATACCDHLEDGNSRYYRGTVVP